MVTTGRTPDDTVEIDLAAEPFVARLDVAATRLDVAATRFAAGALVAGACFAGAVVPATSVPAALIVPEAVFAEPAFFAAGASLLTSGLPRRTGLLPSRNVARSSSRLRRD